MKKRSAGILMYRRPGPQFQVLLVHPGGPFWAKKDFGAWSIPKGECHEGEETLVAAKREFREELGVEPVGAFLELGSLVQPSRKEITAWAVQGDFPVAELTSNTFELEWPPKSGRTRQFPEVDRAEWFSPDDARRKIVPGQVGFIDRLAARLDVQNPEGTAHERKA
jgi:predicted NUDIX family NTP pyrophosphohydrolase